MSSRTLEGALKRSTDSVCLLLAAVIWAVPARAAAHGGELLLVYSGLGFLLQVAGSAAFLIHMAPVRVKIGWLAGYWVACVATPLLAGAAAHSFGLDSFWFIGGPYIGVVFFFPMFVISRLLRYRNDR